MTTEHETRAHLAVAQIREWGQGTEHEAELLIEQGVQFFKELDKASAAIAQIRSDAGYGVFLFRQDEYGRACEMLAEVEKHLQNARDARDYVQALHKAMRQGQAGSVQKTAEAA